MPFSRNIEIGRVAMVNYGPDYGKLLVIVDVLDATRVVVDNATMVRSVALLKRLVITDLKVEVGRLAKKGEVTAACEGLEAKFCATGWGKKVVARKAKASMSDFDRYKAMIVKTRRSRLVRKAYNALKKSA